MEGELTVLALVMMLGSVIVMEGFFASLAPYIATYNLANFSYLVPNSWYNGTIISASLSSCQSTS